MKSVSGSYSTVKMGYSSAKLLRRRIDHQKKHWKWTNFEETHSSSYVIIDIGILPYYNFIRTFLKKKGRFPQHCAPL